MQKRLQKRRYAAAVLTAAMLMATPAAALFSARETEAAAVPADGAPVARELEIHTYKNIPYRTQFLSTDYEGDDVTYALKQEPKRGSVEIDGANFTYTPLNGKTGTDSFTYVAIDTEGNESAPATVTVTISKVKSDVTYSDMEENPAAAAAQQLAETGIFTGCRIGEKFFFEPDRTVSRSEFLAMTMEAAGVAAMAVTMTGFCDDSSIPVWAKAYASAGLSSGVVQGSETADGIAFRGEDPITYNEAASVLDRVLSVRDVDLKSWYTDREAVPSWAAQAVGNMEAEQVLAAGSFGSSTLENPVTRAAAAQMLVAAQDLLKSERRGPLDWLTG